MSNIVKLISIICINVLCMSITNAASHIVNLDVKYKIVNFKGSERKAISVNNQIPAPTLHFKEGDNVTINVYNHLDEETAIHWHGIILPWQMDGVLGITQHGIPPGGVFSYKFTLNQSGTYWYHAHADLQEQQGLYGAFLIDPLQKPNYSYTKDYVVVLSDWSNTHPNQILANLKKEGDYYSPNFPLQPSLVKFIQDYQKASTDERKQLVDDYKMMQQMRMSIYDLSDIAYDAFLLNGQPKSSPWTAPVKVGDVVRLRFIGAGGSTVFHIKIPNTTMQMVHVNGNDVVPYDVSDFTVAPGETFDVLVKIQNDDPYIIYAESIDTVGAAYGALITSPDKIINYGEVKPFPEPKPVTRDMMAMMMGDMKHGSLPSESNTSKSKFDHKTDLDSMTPEMPMIHNDHNTPSNHKDHKSMDSSMKIDKNMPMNHSMPKSKEEVSSKSVATKEKSQENPKNDANSSSHAMHMDSIKMDKGMPISHKMPSSNEHNKKPQNKKKMGMMSSSHSMHMNNSMKMDHNMSMNHSKDMSMPTESTIIGDKISLPNSTYKTSYGTKYENLVSTVKTNNPNKPVAGIINMELFGYMERFIWFINGVPEYDAKPIILEPDKRYRMIFTNTSMMRHPMHIHGHWFILRKGNDAYDPLLHTIEVAPGATITADIDTDASGQWLFHCHMLYHMMTGMSRTFQYSTLIAITNNEVTPQNLVEQTSYHNRPTVRVDEITPINHHIVQHPMAHSMGIWLATFLDVDADPFNNVQQINYKGLYGKDYHKLELLLEDAEIKKGKIENANLDIFYWHLLDQFWAIKGGVNYVYRPAKTPYWQPGIGLEGLMPYFIDTNLRGYFYRGSVKLDIELSRDTQLTNNFFVRTGLQGVFASKTLTKDSIGRGLNSIEYTVRAYYRVMPGLSVFAEYEYEQDYGVLKKMNKRSGESTNNNTLSLGVSVLL